MPKKSAVNVHVDLRGLIKLRRIIRKGLERASGPIRDAIRQWAYRYRGFAQERFDRFSKGRGDWPGLKASTIRQRRRGDKRARGKRKRASILRDTGTIFSALEPNFIGAPGQLEKDIPFGVRVGFGGPHKHPKGKATIADIAHFHQSGTGPLPKREIIVDPDRETQEGMAEDMESAFRKVIRQVDVG